ncbi:MAG: exosortase/archaeosortase family protein [Mycobacteriales bacterium]
MRQRSELVRDAIPRVAPVAALASRSGTFLARSPWGRLSAVVLAVAVAYHYSLMTLLRTLGLDTPLAYLGLVPIIAVGVLALRARPALSEPLINDRQVDFIVGLPLLAAAIAIVIFLPARMSTLFWYYRVDLLSLPLFAAGAIALLVGVRTLWRCRLAIAFLILAWPLPYIWALNKGLNRFTNLTLGALHAIIHHLPVAVALPGGDGSQFLVGHGARAFQVSVASACTGVDSFLGFLLVGGALLGFLDGTRLRKLSWLVSGLVLVYTLNLGRILLIFWTGSTLGQTFAIDGLHPFIGLALFGCGVAAMVKALPLYRLRIRPGVPRAPAATSDRPPGWLASGGLRTAGAIVAAGALALGVANAGLSRYTLVASELGAPRLTSFLASPAQVAGWSVTRIGDYTWTQRFFGSGSSWIRYQYSPTGSSAPTSVIADVVTTSNLTAFNSYGIQDCYRFHGYGLSLPRSYALGGGVQGRLLTFRDPSLPEDWNALYWVWAVRTAKGTRYERIVLLAPAQAPYLASSAGVNGPSAVPAARLASTQRAAGRQFLVNFARALVHSRAVLASKSAPSTSTASQSALAR